MGHYHRHKPTPKEPEVKFLYDPRGYEIYYSDALANRYRHTRTNATFHEGRKVHDCKLTYPEYVAYVNKGTESCIDLLTKRLGNPTAAWSTLYEARGYRDDEPNPRMKGWYP
jgi:hypothetical protein